MSVGQNSFQEECIRDWFKYLTVLEKEIKEVLANFDQKWVKVSFILSKLDLSFVEQRKSEFSPESLVKLYLYRRIKGVSYYDQLIDYLRKNESEAYELGFLKDENNILVLPTKRAFNKFFQNKISLEAKLFLDKLAKEILRIATEKGVVLDLEIVQKVVGDKKSKKRESRKAFHEAVKLVKKLVYPQIDIKIKENGKFTTKDLLDVLVHVAYSHDFTTNGSSTFQELYQDKQAPSGDLMLYHFSKLGSTEKVKEMFEKIFDVIFEFAKQNYKLLNRRKVNIAYDIHKIPYYGDKNDPYVVEGKHERGTTHFYQFLTCSIVVAGHRFTIDAIPIHKFDNIDELVDKSLERVKQKINIDKAFFDRGFDKPKIVNVIKAHKIKFVMPKIRSETVKAWMRKSEDCKARFIKDFEIGTKEKAIVNLILVDDEEGIKRAFITNFYIPEQLAHYLYTWYSKRWGIETGYRQLDHDFKAKTTSKNYNIRLFYFLFSVCLYNLWVLVNICVSLTLYGRLSEKPIVTAKLFAVVLYKAAYEDPPT
ncbi:MAG: hypothetical protein Q8O03_04270 [Nanoarchaeota archaeon]|nr:hypothetical protein [Nanoarchaeota archaeon]